MTKQARRDAIPMELKLLTIELYDSSRNKTGDERLTAKAAMCKAGEKTGVEIKAGWLKQDHATLYGWRKSVEKAAAREKRKALGDIQIDAATGRLHAGGVMYYQSSLVEAMIDEAVEAALLHEREQASAKPAPRKRTRKAKAAPAEVVAS
tara:strand:- start:761 stop:1210 length:450 start_codon:yes stop_codon:yes gene_type:complete